MAKLTFQKHAHVTDPPLSLTGYEGDITNIQLHLQEYLIISGDIGAHPQTRDQKLQHLRDEIQKKGHTIEIINN